MFLHFLHFQSNLVTAGSASVGTLQTGNTNRYFKSPLVELLQGLALMMDLFLSSFWFPDRLVLTCFCLTRLAKTPLTSSVFTQKSKKEKQ